MVTLRLRDKFNDSVLVSNSNQIIKVEMNKIRERMIERRKLESLLRHNKKELIKCLGEKV